MKKALKITGWTLLSLILLILLAAIIIPIAFKPQILDFAKTKINQSINADVDFDDLHLSLFKGFPNLYIALDNIEVINREPFAGDTLAQLERFALEVNLKSLFDPANMEVREILLLRPTINAHIDTAGRANWNITYPTEKEEDKDTVSEPLPKLGVKLKRLAIQEANLAYLDDRNGLNARTNGLNLTLKGDLSLDRSILDLALLIDRLYFAQNGIVYAPNLEFQFDAQVDADLANSHYTLKDNSLRINDLQLLFEGSVAMPPDSIVLDVAFHTPSTAFKSILSLIPAIYAKNFSAIQTNGVLALNGDLRGVMHGKTMPSANLELAVRDANLQYPDLPKSVNDINIDLKAHYNGTTPDASRLDLNRFELTMADNPISAQAHVRTPFSDLDLKANVKGTIDLGTVKEIIPLDAMSLSGKLDADIALEALLSQVQKKLYDQCKLDGHITISDVSLTGVLDPHTVQVHTLQLNFTPQRVELPALKANVANSDLDLKGEISRFLPYLMANDTLQARVKLNSNLIDLNTLFPSINEPSEEEKPDKPADTAAVDLSIANRLRARIEMDAQQVLFQKLDLQDVHAYLDLHKNNLTIEKLGCQALDGSLHLDGTFAFPKEQTPHLKANLSLKNIDVRKSVNTFTTVQKLISSANHMEGNVSLSMDLDTKLDRRLSPIVQTINSEGTLRTSTLRIVDAPLFAQIGRFLGDDRIATPSLDASRIDFGIYDGRLYMQPFNFTIKQFPVGLKGSVGIDQTLDLDLDLDIPKNAIPKGSDLLDLAQSYLPQGISIPDHLPVRLHVCGPTSSPQFDLKLEEGFTQNLTDQVVEKVEEKVEEVKQQVTERVSEEAEKILARAREEANRLVKLAEELAQRTEQEANDRADQLVKEAETKGFLAKKGAEVAAKELREKGKQAADAIRSEARSKADQVLAKAQQQVDNLNK